MAHRSSLTHLPALPRLLVPTRVREPWSAWPAVAFVLAVATGILAAAAPVVLLDLTLVAVAATVFTRWPFVGLAGFLVARAALAEREYLDILLIVGGVVALVLTAPRLHGRRLVIPFVLFLLIAAPTLPLSPSADERLADDWLRLPLVGIGYLPAPSAELREWIRLVAVVVVFCLAGSVVRDARGVRLVALAVLLSAVPVVALALEQLVTGSTVARAGFAAVSGPFEHPNYLAMYLVVIVVLALVAAHETRHVWLRAASRALLVLAGVCLLLTYTRAAWIGVAVALLAMAALVYRRLFAVGALLLVCAFVASPQTVATVEQRFADLSGGSPQNVTNSWSWRVDQWERMLPYGLERPLTGQGFGTYRLVTVREFGLGLTDELYGGDNQAKGGLQIRAGFSAHNDYVKAAVELGAPGLLLWTAVLIGAASVAWVARRHEALRPWAIATAVLGLVLAAMSFSDNVQGYTAVLLYAFAMAGALAGAHHGLTVRGGAPSEAGARDGG